ncbi:cobalt/nickel transport system permease protein [Agrobacterium vitis]|nr:cobalt/nickel transport system permease protein [Agrobacterium vitis]MBE1440450.1 cobalt/nickel transport system permease protein [Agrobacterium vitis]
MASFLALVVFTSIAGPAPAATGVLAVLCLYLMTGQRLRWRRLLHLEGFLILLFLTLPFTLPGQPAFHLGPLVASREGIWQAFTLALKVTASVLMIALVIGSTEPIRLGIALRSLRVPEALVRLFVSLTLNVSFVQLELTRLRDAMRMRGFRARSNRHTWRSYGYLFGMLFIRAIDRAERVEEAMRLRGYSGLFPRTEMPKPSLKDWIAAVMIVGGATLLLIWDRS